MYIKKEVLEIFRCDLCKDQRKIVIMNNYNKLYPTEKIMRKYNFSKDEFEEEKGVINFLSRKGITGIPSIIETGVEKNIPYIDIEYFEGIRVYNLLAYIRKIDPREQDIYSKAQELKKIIIINCLNRQIQIQKALIEWSKNNNKNKVYPQSKLLNIVKILVLVMNLDIDFEKIESELSYLTIEFDKRAMVPFRDSTFKNMLIFAPELYLGKFIDDDTNVFQADEKRFEYFKVMLKENKYNILKDEKKLIDFDFSSCEYLTTPYDDPIGFLCHEITYNGIPSDDKLIWSNEFDKNDYLGIAISYIVRYIRFGGRKLVYHIFHPNAYKYRFFYDDEFFYFKKLNDIISHFWPESKKNIPEFIKFIDMVKNFNINLLIDDKDIFEIKYPKCNRSFYLDIFPY